MTEICFVAQFPPPIHGLSKAVDTLYNSRLRDKYKFSKVDITNNKAIFKSIAGILKSRADVFYFTLSQTRGGNIRDIILMKLMLGRKKKVIVHLHGGYYRTMVDKGLGKLQRRINYSLLSRVDEAIVLGDSLRWIFEGMVDDDKIKKVPNCVDDEYLISKEEFLSKLEAMEEKKVKNVLYLSNMIESKGYRYVLNMALTQKKRVDAGDAKKFHFDFAGAFFEKAEQEYFETFVRENDLAEYVTYHGVVKGEAKNELLKNSDVFTLLTRYPNEGQPISILEAMGNGMLVVTTDHAGIPDIAGDDNALVVKKGQEIDCEALLDRMYSKDTASLLLRAREDVERMYRQSNYIENMDSCFSAVIDGE
ncbi:MAG: glycosyltransferase family 4 protein [Lachnospiraceae bacterium]|nr:glycosyltransferase family 4 protein [Lachnospiraceae bacterium]